MKNSKTIFFILMFVAAHFFHHLLTAILVPLLPFIRDGFDLSYAQSGAVVSAFTIAYGFGQLPAGWLSDRVGPRYMLLAGISGVAIAGALIGISTSYMGLLIFLVLLGIMGGGYHPSASPLITAAVPASQRGKAIGIHIVGGSISNFLSPLVAVFIAGYLGWRGSYITISLPVFVFGLWLFFLMLRNDIRARRTKEASPQPAAEENPVGQESVSAVEADAGADAVAGTTAEDTKEMGDSRRETLPNIIIILVISAAMGAAVGSSVSFVPLLVVDSLGYDQQTAALLLSIYFGTGIAAAPLGGIIVDRYGPLVLFFSVALLSGPIIILMGIIPHWGIMAVIMLSLGTIAFFRMTSSEIFFVSRVPGKYRSTVLGVYYFAGMEGRGIVSPFLGGAIDTWGFTASYTAVGLILSLIVAVCLAIFFILQRKRLRG
ncbi:MAG: MFS transporter [Spirochaetaceae bacterium]